MRGVSLIGLAALLSGPGAAAEVAPFGFAPPELTLADYNARELRAGDFTRDGKIDLVALNDNRGRVDFFLHTDGDGPRPTPTLHRDRWRPVLSHPRFQRESLIPDHPARSLAVGDFNQDGVADFAITNDQNECHIYHGPLRTEWVPHARLDVEAVQTAPGVLRWDPEERALTLLGSDSIQEIRWTPENETYSTQIVGSPPAGENPNQLFFLDVDGDGRRDVLYHLRGSRFNLAVHLRHEDGLGSLIRPPMDPPAKAYEPVPGGEPALYALHQRSPTLLRFTFRPAGARADVADHLDLRFLHLPDTGLSQSLWNDLDGNGHPDLLLLPRARPEILVLRQQANQRFDPPVPHPLPTKADWMIPGRFLAGDKAPQFLAHDADTGFLGLVRHTRDRLSPPIPVPNADAIIAATAWPDPDGDTDLLAGVVRTPERDYLFRLWRLRREKETGPLEREVLQELDLPDVNRDMDALMRIDQAEAPERFLFAPTPLGDGFFLVPDEDGTFAVHTPPKGFSASRVERSSATDYQLSPAGTPVPTRWARLQNATIQFLRLTPDARVDVVEQLNLKQRGRAAAFLPLNDGDGQALAVLDRSNNQLEIHHREANGAYRFDREIGLPSLQPQRVELARDPEGGYLLRIQARNQVALLRDRPPRFHPRSDTLYETDLPNTQPGRILTGDFNGDGGHDIGLMDSTARHSLEFLSRVDTQWRSRMHFQIFESAPGASGRRGGAFAPRETLVRDIDGDGLDDMVLLVHDRILLYLQDPVPDAE